MPATVKPVVETVKPLMRFRLRKLLVFFRIKFAFWKVGLHYWLRHPQDFRQFLKFTKSLLPDPKK